MNALLNIQLEALEQQKNEALAKAMRAYYDENSPAYGDNERYKWAIDTITKKFNELKKDTEKDFYRITNPNSH